MALVGSRGLRDEPSAMDVNDHRIEDRTCTLLGLFGEPPAHQPLYRTRQTHGIREYVESLDVLRILEF